EFVVLGAPQAWTVAGLGALLLGYCGAGAISAIGLDRIVRPDLYRTLLGIPLYWLLAWYAVILACGELITKPYHWSKTEHRGLGSTLPAGTAIRVPSGKILPQRTQTSR